MTDNVSEQPRDRVSASALLRFLIPSLIGIFCFLVPIEYDGSLTILIGVLTSLLNGLLASSIEVITLVILGISAVLSPVFRWGPAGLRERYPGLTSVFAVAPGWIALRGVGFLFALMITGEWGPEIVWGAATGQVVFYDLATALIALFMVAVFLLPLLTDFGAMELIGVAVSRVFRTLFTLPGRSAVDATASWLAAAAVGILITSQQYEKGYYSAREACVIATNFSIVSLPFCLLIATVLGIEAQFIPFYLTVTAVGLITAMILPRIPPLSRLVDSYMPEDGKQLIEETTGDGSRFGQALDLAVARAAKAPGPKAYVKSASLNLLDIWFGLLPGVMVAGLIGLVIAEHTPIIHWLSLPLVPVLELLRLPEAAAAAPALLVGFAEMFLPAVMGKGIESELTRFVIAGVSVSQLIYMSEVGILILKSPIPLRLRDLAVIFLLRTAIALPLIALAGHLIIGGG